MARRPCHCVERASLEAPLQGKRFVTRKTSFYYSFLVLPAAQRQAILAVFDFCRAVDDSVDLESDPARAQTALDRWREEVGRVFERGEPLTAQGRTVAP